MSEIQRADRTLRRRVIILVGVLMICAVVAHFFAPPLHILVATSMGEAVIAIVIWLFIVAAGVYFFRLGSAVRRASRFPLPGQRVLRDTVVLSGAAAAKQGRSIQVVGFLFFLIAGGLLFFAVRIYMAFFSPHA